VRITGLCLFALALLTGVLLANPPAVSTPRLSADELTAHELRAGQDPVKALQLVPLAQDEAARKLRQRVAQLLTMQKRTATAAELEALAVKLASVLPGSAASQPDVREVLGRPVQTGRQLLYNRYLEEWLYDDPLPLCVVFDCRKGQEPRVLTVQPLRTRQP
jgi:hypothetical protein